MANTQREYIMSEEAREAARNYARKWRAAHPEKSREYQREYWKRRGEKERAEREGGNGEKS